MNGMPFFLLFVIILDGKYLCSNITNKFTETTEEAAERKKVRLSHKRKQNKKAIHKCINSCHICNYSQRTSAYYSEKLAEIDNNSSLWSHSSIQRSRDTSVQTPLPPTQKFIVKVALRCLAT